MTKYRSIEISLGGDLHSEPDFISILRLYALAARTR